MVTAAVVLLGVPTDLGVPVAVMSEFVGTERLVAYGGMPVAVTLTEDVPVEALTDDMPVETWVCGAKDPVELFVQGTVVVSRTLTVVTSSIWDAGAEVGILNADEEVLVHGTVVLSRIVSVTTLAIEAAFVGVGAAVPDICVRFSVVAALVLLAALVLDALPVLDAELVLEGLMAEA